GGGVRVARRGRLVGRGRRGEEYLRLLVARAALLALGVAEGLGGRGGKEQREEPAVLAEEGVVVEVRLHPVADEEGQAAAVLDVLVQFLQRLLAADLRHVEQVDGRVRA